MVVKVAISFLTAHSDSVLVTDVDTIVTSLTANPNYTTPNPALTVITTANDAFLASITAAADGGKQLTWAKKMRRAELVALMRQLCAYIQMACEGDMTKLLSSGVPVQKPNHSKAEIPATPQAPKVSQGLTGQAKLATKAVVGAFIYNWQVALASAPETVVLRAQSTSAKTDLPGLTPGQDYLFKVNAVGTAGTSDLSDAGSRIII
jgi:hypothetical protein